MTRLARALVPVGLVSLLFAGLAAAQKPGEIISGRYLVTFRPGVAEPAVAAHQLSQQHGFRVRHVYRFALRGMAIEIPQPAELRVLRALQRDPRVASIGHDRYVTAFAQTLPKGVNRVNAEPGVGASTAAGIDIAVIDTGLDFAHADLAANIDAARSVNCIGDTGNCVAGGNDDNGHGTFVGGVLAAINNTIDVVGAGPQAKLLSVKVLKSDGSGSFTDVIAGVNYVAGLAQSSNPVEVANMSLGATCATCTDNSTDPTFSAFHDAVRGLVNAGTTVVVAAGNDGANAANTIPASYDEVVTVSAMADSDGRPGGQGPPVCQLWLLACFSEFADDSFALDPVWGFSNFGPDIDVIAPGVQETSLNRGGGVNCPPGALNCGSGTSFASPHAAGVAAILIRDRVSKGQPTPLPATVRQALIQTGECHEGAGTVFHGTTGCSTVWPNDPDGIGEPLVRGDNVVNFAPSAISDVAVTSVSAPGPVVTGTTNSVSVGVANEGTQSETFNVTLRDSLAASISSAQSVTLAAGASSTVTFTWQPNVAGDHVLTAEAATVAGETDTADNSKSATVTVRDPTHDVAVLLVSAPASAPQGGTATVSVEVTNEGTEAETFGVSVTDTPTSGAAGTLSPGQQVTLLPGASTTLNFTWDTSGAGIGDHTLIASAEVVNGEADTADNSKSTVSNVVTPVHDVAVTQIISQTVVVAPNDLGIQVNLTNEGTFTETFTVTATDAPPFNGTAGSFGPSNPQTVTLGPGETAAVLFIWDTGTASFGDHVLTFTADLSSDQDAADNARSVTVTYTNQPHDVAVTSITAAASVTEGATATVTVVVQNVGSVDMSNVTLSLTDVPASGGTAGSTSCPQPGTLAPGGTFTADCTWATSGASTGTHLLRAIAGPVQDDSNLANNIKETTSSVLLAPPSGLTATAGKAGRQVFVDLTWTDSSVDETDFVIERCQGSGCTNFSPLATVGANTAAYRDTNGLARKTVYRYQVKARKSGLADSGYSNVAQARTP